MRKWNISYSNPCCLIISYLAAIFNCLWRCVVTAFLAIPPQQFKLVLDSVIWAFKHTMRNVSDTGLSILYQMLQNIAANDAAAQSFYQTYYTDVLQHIFSVVTDSSHTAGMPLFSIWDLCGSSCLLHIMVVTIDNQYSGWFDITVFHKETWQ